jgi:hypothetical protein
MEKIFKIYECYINYSKTTTFGTLYLKEFSLIFESKDLNISIIILDIYNVEIIYWMFQNYITITKKNKEQIYFYSFDNYKEVEDILKHLISYNISLLNKKDDKLTKLIKEYKEINENSIIELEIQNKKMEEMKNKVDKINYNLTLSDRIASGFDSINGTISNLFKKFPEKPISFENLEENTFEIILNSGKIIIFKLLRNNNFKINGKELSFKRKKLL